MKFRDLVYAALEGRPEYYPQDLVGILSHVGQARGVLSEADHDKLPNHADLSFSLQSLIETGQIAEVSPQRYFDPDQRRPGTFSGISREEYDRACAAHYRRLQEKRTWKVGAATWPGLERLKRHIEEFIVLPSPDGRFACVVYSLDEIRMGMYVGRLVLLRGPPEKATVAFCPSPNFTCCIDESHWRPAVQWVDGSRYCAMTSFNQPANRIAFVALTILDVVNEAFAYEEDVVNEAADEEDVDDSFIIFEKEGSWVIRRHVMRHFPNDDISWGYEERKLLPAELAWRSWQDLNGIGEKPTRTIWQRIRSLFAGS